MTQQEMKRVVVEKMPAPSFRQILKASSDTVTGGYVPPLNKKKITGTDAQLH